LRRFQYGGRSALVTGASSGVGEAFARALAAEGAAVLLAALPEDGERLHAIAAELAKRHRVRTDVVPVDLSEPGAPGLLVEAADRLAFEPSVLVNSAGFGGVGAFAEQPLERQLEMIRVNVLALVAMTGAYLPRMIRRGDGVVVNVASTAAFQPLPYMATYAATKAFVLAFGEALWAEARSAGVRVATVCPDPVASRFHDRAWDDGAAMRTKREHGPRELTVQEVVNAAFATVDADRPRSVVRVPFWRALSVAASTAGAFVPRRWEMLAIERLSRSLWHSG
jgi:short-subunit dehydrogenase